MNHQLRCDKKRRKKKEGGGRGREKEVEARRPRMAGWLAVRLKGDLLGDRFDFDFEEARKSCLLFFFYSSSGGFFSFLLSFLPSFLPFSFPPPFLGVVNAKAFSVHCEDIGKKEYMHECRHRRIIWTLCLCTSQIA